MSLLGRKYLVANVTRKILPQKNVDIYFENAQECQAKGPQFTAKMVV